MSAPESAGRGESGHANHSEGTHKPSGTATPPAARSPMDPVTARRAYLRAWEKALVAVCAVAAMTAATLYVFGVGMLGAYEKLLFSDLVEKVVMLCLCAPLPVAVLILGIGKVGEEIKEAASVPYVPPVRRQRGDLAAEHVLLRGSLRPVADSEELLRASGAMPEARPDEMLRSLR